MSESNTPLSSIMSIHHCRGTQDNIPPDKDQRNRLLGIIRDHVRRNRPVPPVSVPELQEYAGKIIEIARVDPKYRNFILVLISNEIWRDILAGIPFERRLLLLPKCLRHAQDCPADGIDSGSLGEYPSTVG